MINILLADDSNLVRERIVKSLEGISANIFEAGDLNLAFEVIENKKPELSVIDIALPDGSGFDILKKIKKVISNSVTIIFTNYPYEQFKKKADELGADFFFDKANDFDKVVKELIKQIESRIKEKKMKKNILVVDDSSIMRKMVIASLKDLKDVHFLEAKNGLEAIEFLAVSKIDIVMLDLNMPDMHGMEVLQFIRSNKIYEKTPVVILTTKSDEQSKISAMNAGATCYLTKPFDPNELFNNIKNILVS